MDNRFGELFLTKWNGKKCNFQFYSVEKEHRLGRVRIANIIRFVCTTFHSFCIIEEIPLKISVNHFGIPILSICALKIKIRKYFISINGVR